MKDSGIEWIGEIPVSWETIKIKNICTIVSGATPEKNEKYWDGDINWVTPADYKTNDKVVYSGRRNLSREGYRACSTILVPEGSLIFSKRAPIGSVAIAGNELCTNQGCLSCIVKDEINETFVYYVLCVGTEHFELMGSGTTFKEISATTFGNCSLPIPVLNEQIEIVNYLDTKCSEIDQIAADIQSEIEILEQYRKSFIAEALTNGLHTDISIVETGYSIWPRLPYDWKLMDIKYIFEIKKRIAGKEGYDVLSITHRGIKPKRIDSNEGQIAADYSNYQFVYPGDFAMNGLDLNAGWCDISNLFGVTSPDYRVFRIKDSDKYYDQYFKFIFQMGYTNKIFYALTQGVTESYRRLSTDTFMNLKLPVPPISEQKDIANVLSEKCAEINRIIDSKRDQLTTLEEYKKSLIFEYVTGKKEVPVP